LTPGATEAEVRLAFRAQMKRFHPDVHAGAPWAVAKARRVVAAGAVLRGRGSGAASADAAARPASGRRRWWQGPEVLFYPEVVDYWADWGASPPSAEDAAAFQARCAAAAQQAEARRAAAQQARAAAEASGADAAERAQRMGVLLVAAALALALSHSGVSDANHGARRGAPAAGDCAARGGGWCRFL
jgi:hypothetical protein